MDTPEPDDPILSRLLAEAGAGLDAAQAFALVRGVLAAPPGADPDAWLVLAGGGRGGALDDRLRALKAEMAAAADDGLGGEAPRAPRLAALRAELKRRGLDGFVVPRGDEHMGEYVPRHAERLAWLTGFTGSAGQAVVLAGAAALFVDGRYTLQAAAEVDGAAWERRHLTEEPAESWLAERLPAGARLGYDPWLHTPVQTARLSDACAKAGGTLVAVETNPIDAVWREQPPPPLAPVVPHDLVFAGMASADKRRRVADALGNDRVDAVFLAAPDSIAWLLNVRGGDVPFTPLPLAFAVVDGDGGVELFIDRRKLTPAAVAHLGEGVRVCDPAELGAALDRLGEGKRTVRINPDGAPAWAFDRLERAGARISRGADPCQPAKAVKNAVELAGARAAHRRDGAALARFLAWLEKAWRDGLTELAAAARLEALRRSGEHFRGLSFPTISGAGPNGAIVHYRATERTDRRLEPGSLYLVDSGAQYLDGTTDVTRTVAIGEPDAEMRDRFTRVLKGHVAVATARFPRGTTGSQIDPLARRALWQAGLDYDHGTGHGVGSYLGVHEGPQRVSKLPSTVALEPGMIVSDEPGYYRTGAYGIRIENLVVVVEAAAPPGAERPLLGFEPLTLAPIDLTLVEPALLDSDEVAWLDAYHARVRAELTSLVDSGTAAWLARATRPLA